MLTPAVSDINGHRTRINERKSACDGNWYVPLIKSCCMHGRALIFPIRHLHHQIIARPAGNTGQDIDRVCKMLKLVDDKTYSIFVDPIARTKTQIFNPQELRL